MAPPLVAAAQTHDTEPMIRFDNVAKRYATGHEDFPVSTSISNPVRWPFHRPLGRRQEHTAETDRPAGARHTRAGVGQRAQPQQAQDTRHPYHRREVGMIFQDHRLLHDRTVFDNIALPLVVAGMGHAEINRRVRAALDKVSLLKKEKVYPITLSGGEQQQVGIARALVSKPPVLLADEPTGNLDPELSREIVELFVQFNQVGVTLLIATHDVDLINSFDKRIINLRNGRVAGDSAEAH